MRYAGGAGSAAAVDCFMRRLAHRFKREVGAIRRAHLQAAPGVTEGIKWNAPSYCAAKV